MKKILILFLVISCNNFNYSYWKLSDFKLKSNEDRNLKKVQLIYTSSYGSNFDELNAYIHYVAFIAETKDTFNILSPIPQKIEQNELETKFILHTEKDERFKTMMIIKQTQMNNSDGNQLLNGRLRKVLRDPNFDEIAKNNYETEFGVIFRSDKNIIQY